MGGIGAFVDRVMPLARPVASAVAHPPTMVMTWAGGVATGVGAAVASSQLAGDASAANLVRWSGVGAGAVASAGLLVAGRSSRPAKLLGGALVGATTGAGVVAASKTDAYRAVSEDRVWRYGIPVAGMAVAGTTLALLGRRQLVHTGRAVKALAGSERLGTPTKAVLLGSMFLPKPLDLPLQAFALGSVLTRPRYQRLVMDAFRDPRAFTQAEVPLRAARAIDALAVDRRTRFPRSG